MKVHLKEINLKMEEKIELQSITFVFVFDQMMIVENKIKYERSKSERVTAIATTLKEKIDNNNNNNL